ncbi:hypothetical protein [Bradyrhizobium sp. F1.4.3]|uniref:hypothetical protein n=1 Tax=Bradyrhizobium sp. F1.4.3 TaxID=3156356 RepID=UPI0033989EA4
MREHHHRIPVGAVGFEGFAGKLPCDIELLGPERQEGLLQQLGEGIIQPAVHELASSLKNVIETWALSASIARNAKRPSTSS